MKEKKNNNLICVEHKGTKRYFTSVNRVAKHIGANPAAVEYALKNDKLARNTDGKQWVVYFVDGSEIMYKDINN